MNRERLAESQGAGWRVFGVTSLAVFMVSLDATVVVAVFPALRRSFEASPDWLLSWILNAYTIVYAALLVPAGRWADRVGHTRAFLVGLAVFTVASALCGMAAEANFLIAMRVMQAAGAAVLTPAALAVALEGCRKSQRPFVVGLWSASGALAAASGPALGSWLVDLTSWSMIFWMNVPLGLAAWWFACVHLPDSPADRLGVMPDATGSVLTVAGVGFVCVAIVRSADVGAGTTMITLLVGLGLLVAFVVWVRKHPVSARDFSIFQNRDVALANLATLIFGVCFGMMFLSFFFFMTEVWDFPQRQAGLAALPGPLMVIPSAVWSGRLATRLGQRRLVMAGGLIFASANFWYFLRVSDEPRYLAIWLPGQILSGLAIGLVLPSLTSRALTGMSSELLGIGSAVNSALRQIGAAIGVSVTVAMISHTGLILPTFRAIYLLLVLGGFCVAAVAFRLGEGAVPQKGSKATNGPGVVEDLVVSPGS